VSTSATPRAVFWTGFLTSLKDRGLAGVNLVISDAHRGLQAQVPGRCKGSARHAAVSI
jgi:putative transposase